LKQSQHVSVFIIDPIFVAISQSAKDDSKILINSLVKKAQDGDEAAFGQIYDLYFDKVYRFVYFRVNHREAAEDLVSETFIRAWDKLDRISSPESFSGWVYQIARNLVIDYYRSRKENVDIALLENVLSYEDNVVNRTDLGFQQQIFLKFLDQLGEEQQLVLKMKFLEDLDNPEIAAILNKTEGAVRVIQHRAIAELKKLIAASNNDFS